MNKKRRPVRNQSLHKKSVLVVVAPQKRRSTFTLRYFDKGITYVVRFKSIALHSQSGNKASTDCIAATYFGKTKKVVRGFSCYKFKESEVASPQYASTDIQITI